MDLDVADDFEILVVLLDLAVLGFWEDFEFFEDFVGFEDVEMVRVAGAG